MTINELYQKLGKLKEQSLGDKEIRIEYDGPDANTDLEIDDIEIYDNGNIVITAVDF